MYRFAVENIYIIIEAVQQIRVQGLDCVCKQLTTKEKQLSKIKVFQSCNEPLIFRDGAVILLFGINGVRLSTK